MNRFLCLAGATGIAPSASNFGGTDFQTRLGLERLLKRAFLRDFCFLKGISCLLWSFYIGLCKTARKTFIIVRFDKRVFLGGMKIFRRLPISLVIKHQNMELFAKLAMELSR